MFDNKVKVHAMTTGAVSYFVCYELLCNALIANLKDLKLTYRNCPCDCRSTLKWIVFIGMKYKTRTFLAVTIAITFYAVWT